jgi:hypothetical protein
MGPWETGKGYWKSEASFVLQVFVMEEDNGKKTMVDSGNLFLAFINTHEMIQNKPYNPFTRLFVSDNSDMQSELCNSSMNMNDVPPLISSKLFCYSTRSSSKN